MPEAVKDREAKPVPRRQIRKLVQQVREAGQTGSLPVERIEKALNQPGKRKGVVNDTQDSNDEDDEDIVGPTKRVRREPSEAIQDELDIEPQLEPGQALGLYIACLQSYSWTALLERRAQLMLEVSACDFLLSDISAGIDKVVDEAAGKDAGMVQMAFRDVVQEVQATERTQKAQENQKVLRRVEVGAEEGAESSMSE